MRNHGAAVCSSPEPQGVRDEWYEHLTRMHPEESSDPVPHADTAFRFGGSFARIHAVPTICVQLLSERIAADKRRIERSHSHPHRASAATDANSDNSDNSNNSDDELGELDELGMSAHDERPTKG